MLHHFLFSTSVTPYYHTLLVLFIFIMCSIGLFIITGLPLFIYIKNSYKRTKVLPHGETKYKYAVLIPARNESDVINNSLNSMLNQDYDKNYFDVYVIVESEEDPTCQIVREKGFNYYVRKDLENKHTKGWALDECIKYLKTINKKYDAYIVFDADNIAEKSYITKLNDIKNLGYDLGVGDRLFTNAEESWVSACSATLFAYMSKVTCKSRSKFFHKVTLMGAGFYINSNIIDDAGGWIWNDLSEDSQLTNYAYFHNLNCFYYPFAKYYDEQPTTFKVLHKQHIRWVWGYINAGNKKTNNLIYNKDHMKRFTLGKFEISLTLFPFLFFNITTLAHAIASLFLMLSSFIQFGNYPSVEMTIMNLTCSPMLMTFYYFLFAIFLVWLPWLVIPLIIFTIDKQNISWSARTKAVVCLTYFYFFMDFPLAFFDGLIFPRKRRTWKKIEHHGSITCVQANNTLENTTTIEIDKIKKDKK